MAGKKQTKRESKKEESPKPAPRTREQKAAEKQALAMWALLGEGGEAFGGKVRPVIEKVEREALKAADLIDFRKEKGGAYFITVTDRGWDWAEQHLSDPLPEKTFGGAFVLRAWLSRLHSFLKARDLRLAEVLAEQLTKPPADESSPRSLNYSDLRDRIRTAYREVAGGFDQRVLLRDLRPKLADIDRRQVDAALMQMLRDQEASLMQLDYRPDVTDEDHEAALQIGNEPRHIIWISR
jgi:hypothetical protein